MELLQLRYFCALVESQHLSNTAKKLDDCAAIIKSDNIKAGSRTRGQAV